MNMILGAMDGLGYMFHVDPQKLIDSKTWIDGASQVRSKILYTTWEIMK